MSSEPTNGRLQLRAEVKAGDDVSALDQPGAHRHPHSPEADEADPPRLRVRGHDQIMTMRSRVRGLGWRVTHG